MEFVASETNNTNMISWEDLHPNPKRVGSGGGFYTQHNEVDDISNTITLLQHNRSNSHHNMFSFSSQNTQTSSYGNGAQFTPSQWMELEHQALIYKYITANASVPSNLLIPIKNALQTAAYSRENIPQNHFGWGALRMGFCAGSDPEPGRCRRTDGKKWRCAKNAVGDQKYCERHINRGRHRSRKLVEAQNGAAKAMPISKASCEDNSTSSMEAMAVPILSSSSIQRKKGHVSNLEEKSTNDEFGLVCFDSLLNSMHKVDAKSEHLNQFMENWAHSSQPMLSNTSERFDLSRVRMGMGKQEHRVPGGPLGEVLQLGISK
ncbi:growth-regulating factor 7-like [Bidens hawaiensis]|uniref:growth-regulating factor 7-like n=1 Tax=Bidens hawaiensis TaxID=980011 RepID=UPI004049B9F4